MAGVDEFSDAMFAATRSGDTARIVQLVENGATINECYSWGYPISIACMTGQLESIRKLADLGADLNVISDRVNGPPLASIAAGSMHLSNEQNLAVLKLLLELGANPEIPEGHHFHHTPLLIALYHQRTAAERHRFGLGEPPHQIAAARLLLEHGASPDTKDRFGNDAFDFAVWFEVNEVLDELTRIFGPAATARIELARKNKDLMDATKAEDIARVRQLLDDGADVNKVNLYGHDALYYAADKGNVPLIRLLLDRGANPNNLVNEKTPLMTAAYRGHREAFDMLLDAGADIFAEHEMAPGAFNDVLEYARGNHELTRYIKSEMKRRRKEAERVGKRRPTARAGDGITNNAVAERRGAWTMTPGNTWISVLARGDIDQVAAALKKRKEVKQLKRDVTQAALAGKLHAPPERSLLLIQLVGTNWVHLVDPQSSIPFGRDRKSAKRLAQPSGLEVLETGYEDTSGSTEVHLSKGKRRLIRFESIGEGFGGREIEESSSGESASEWAGFLETRFESDRHPADWWRQFKNEQEVQQALLMELDAYVPCIQALVADDGTIEFAARHEDVLEPEHVKRIDLVIFRSS